MSQKLFLAFAIVLCIQQAVGRPQQGEAGQPEPESEPEPGKGAGNLLQQAGGFLDKHKGKITSLLGLSDGEAGGEPKAVLTTILETLKLDNSTITSLIGSVQNAEGFEKIKTTLMSGDLSSLSTVLSEQTGLDSQAITSTTNSIKEGIANLGKGAATSKKVGALLVVLMAFVAM